VRKLAKANGVFDAVICNQWALGGLGAKDLAESVDRVTQQPSNFHFLYDVKVNVMTAPRNCIRVLGGWERERERERERDGWLKGDNLGWPVCACGSKW
jgi:formyltetrahydrofolate synthetase